MRFVAAIPLILVGLSAMPAVPAVNECRDPCVPVTLPGGTPANPSDRTFYLYAQALLCNPPGRDECAGQPAPVVAGVAYEETNRVPGLQRYPGEDHPADSLVVF